MPWYTTADARRDAEKQAKKDKTIDREQMTTPNRSKGELSMDNIMPSREQIDALQRFSEHEGRCWKSALAECWRNGRYPWHVKNTENDEAYLQQVRNKFGPDWLQKLKLSSLQIVSEPIPASTRRHRM